MFGLFEGLFGSDALGRAAEDALEMCILEEMECEDEEDKEDT